MIQCLILAGDCLTLVEAYALTTEQIFFTYIFFLFLGELIIFFSPDATVMTKIPKGKDNRLTNYMKLTICDICLLIYKVNKGFMNHL